ncbi:putative Stage II sporulation protein E [Magnetofaba australis IT-1]|uniref:Putative Stage II sporulation protein E n=1 Tax=Magnetofaba australis IT-1 TaxID=1434232 RepID=A0A1Y2K6U2_9PROT|nr:putative Stage II sporulation protein E [Magnetofaba australis IT-1]
MERSHQLIRESVHYASRIQRSLQPDQRELIGMMRDHFIIWQPKDIVGGDLYWFKPDRTGYMLALFDCTGHGVPGALMTMISVGALEQAFQSTNNPARLTRLTHQHIKTALKQDLPQGESDDGLEMGLCLVEPHRNRLTFCGSRQDLWIIRDGALEMIKGDKAGVGYRRFALNHSYTNHTIKLIPGARYYLFTDGFTDQVGGDKGRGFGKKRLSELLLCGAHLPLARQSEQILQAYEAYQGDHQRRDDLSMIGFQPL